MGEIRDALAALAQVAHLVPSRSRMWRIAATAAVVLAVLVLGGWYWWHERNITWALEIAAPQIRQLLQEDKFASAFMLIERAHKYVPQDAELARLFQDSSYEAAVKSDPPGATVSYRPYPGNNWRELGKTPIDKVRVPRGWLHWRFSMPSYQSEDRLLNGARTAQVKLAKDETVPAGMVFVEGANQPLQLNDAYLRTGDVRVQDAYYDRFEVSNRQFKEFVDAGGYRRQDLWKQPFVKDGKPVAWDEAIAKFRDKTGRPGPATWELGEYPAGQAEYPVTGVSWYEAAAYAEFAGKSLPPILYWSRAAMPQYSSDAVIPYSNFSGRGPAPTGTLAAMNVTGLFDMAGNVKEWCLNEAGKEKRFILGGAYDEPVYQFSQADAQSPFARENDYGFRCIRYAGTAAPSAANTGPVELAHRDFTREKPVSDDVFRTYAGFYAYDPMPLHAVIDYVKDEPQWRKEKITFDTAYNSERMSAYLFLPKTGRPPFQTAIYFPGSSALDERSSDNLETYPVNLMIRSGRAILYPIYKGTYERGDGFRYEGGSSVVLRDHVIQAVKDFSRSFDYLETRSEIDKSKVVFYGFSWGAAMGPYILAVEKRVRVGVLQLGGFKPDAHRPEDDPLNFAPRIKMPVLMVNGRYDFRFPLEASQIPQFRALGTPAKDKKHVIFDTSHRILPNEFAKAILEWLDQYLGSPN